MMIDIHTHILPFVDDGASSQEESLDMLYAAFVDGVSAVVCTPHSHWEEFRNTKDVTEKMLARFLEETVKKRPNMHVLLGCEALVRHNFMEHFHKGEYATLNGSRYILTEFSFRHPPSSAESIYASLLSEGYRPILAHPERYAYEDDNMTDALLLKLTDMGVLLQVTAGSFTGGYGQTAKRKADALLSSGKIAVVASDAHDPYRRTPVLSSAYAYVKNAAGESIATKLFMTNPDKILQDSAITI